MIRSGAAIQRCRGTGRGQNEAESEQRERWEDGKEALRVCRVPESTASVTREQLRADLRVRQVATFD